MTTNRYKQLTDKQAEETGIDKTETDIDKGINNQHIRSNKLANGRLV